MDRRTFISGLQLAIRAAAGTSLALAIAEFLKLEFPIYALLAAVIVTDLTPSQSRQLGLHRLVATVIGAICGAMLSPIFPPGPLAIGLGILLAMLVCQLLNARDGARVAGYVCGIIMLDHSAEPWRYAYLRFIETALGVAVAWSISYVPKLIRVEQPSSQE